MMILHSAGIYLKLIEKTKFWAFLVFSGGVALLHSKLETKSKTTRIRKFLHTERTYNRADILKRGKNEQNFWNELKKIKTLIMAGYGLDGSDHGNNKNEFKTSTYEKRAKILIMADYPLDGSDHGGF